MRLGFGVSFDDLYPRDGLVQIDSLFVKCIAETDPLLYSELIAARAAPDTISSDNYSALIVALAPHVEMFFAALFGIVTAVNDLAQRHTELEPIFSVKRLFVQRRERAKQFSSEETANFDGELLAREVEVLLDGELTELRFATWVNRLMRAPDQHAEALDTATRYAAWATL